MPQPDRLFGPRGKCRARSVPLCSSRDEPEKTKARVRLIGVRPRALGAQRLWRRPCRTFMPRLSGAVQWLGGRGAGLLEEPTYRLYHCRRCGVQVQICPQCDDGNIYCAGECSQMARREGMQRAGGRYQHTLRLWHSLCRSALRGHHSAVSDAPSVNVRGSHPSG